MASRFPLRRNGTVILFYVAIFFCLSLLLLLVGVSNLQLFKYQTGKDGIGSVVSHIVSSDADKLHELSANVFKTEEHLNYLKSVHAKALEGLRQIELRIDSSQGKYLNHEKLFESSKLELKELKHRIANSRQELTDVSHTLSYLKSASVLSVARPFELKVTGKSGELRSEDVGTDKATTASWCSYDSCFDFSNCGTARHFTVQLVQLKKSNYDSIINALPFVNYSQEPPCLYAVVIEDLKTQDAAKKLRNDLEHLPSWRLSGYNHLLLFTNAEENNIECELLSMLQNRAAIAVGQLSHCKDFNKEFDVLLPSLHLSLPAHGQRSRYANRMLVDMNHTHLAVFFEDSKTSRLYASIIGQMSSDIATVVVCSGNRKQNCIQKDDVIDITAKSLYRIITNTKNVSLHVFYTTLFDTLTVRTIPVIIGSYHSLPLSKFVDWKRLGIKVPLARITEVYYFIKTLRTDHIFQFRRQAKMIMNLYFGDASTYFETIFSFVRESTMHLPVILPDIKVEKVTTFSDYNASFVDLMKSNLQMRNISRLTSEVYSSWNEFPGPHRLIPCTPYGALWPAHGHYKNAGMQYNPIVKGVNGGSVPFGRTLAGNHPEEKFTIVILAYDRAVVMMDSIALLSGVNHLHKVIIVWNNPLPPSEQLTWPNINVPIKVIFPGKNSLNNRFLPFDLIETEAVLSLDDDMFLRPADIDFAFRVWRQHRDQIVGFPGRAVDSDGAGNYSYNPTYSCQLSMILTGGAFLHKYYMYLYTYMMPAVFRDFVDEIFNCEDIAMNFLVAYVTQKEPVKVTSRWTFFCPGCSHSLSRGIEHYGKRTMCINKFSQLYGYLPLKSTQFRADSVLFKTKLYGKAEKCYPSV